MNFKNTLVAHFDTKKALIFTINWDIVNMVIGDMLFIANDKEFFVNSWIDIVDFQIIWGYKQPDWA